MPKRPPNFFDETVRMRTPAFPYNPSYDYRPAIQELRNACEANGFIGISPQNIVRGMPLLPVIASKDGRNLRFFVNPRIVKQSGRRLRYEGCGNVYLYRSGRKAHLGVLTTRPTRIVLASKDEVGRDQLHYFTDKESPESVQNGFIGIIVHEMDHLNGRLIVDIARESLVSVLNGIRTGKLSEDELGRLFNDMPFVIQRDGDGYVLRYGMEFLHEPVPEVSPDALFFSPGLRYGLHIASEIKRYRVPRGGEYLPIRISEELRVAFNRKKRPRT